MIAKTPAAENIMWKLRKNSKQRTSASPELCVGRNSPTSRIEPAVAESATSLKQELDTVRRAHAQLQQAIYEAAQVQRKLCAPRELVWGAFEIAGESFPVRHLSGDFFKVMELGAVLGLALGDIAGKGLSAGIWQTHLVDLVQRCARTYINPAEAVAGVNRELCQDPGEPPLTALFFARLDPERNELVYCNAGLPPPLVLRRDNSVERLGEGGPMLGALQQALYTSGTVRLNPGDMLLTYSDGLTECQNPQEEEFEMERLSAAAKAVRGASANQVLFSTLATVLDFADACPPSDDLTLLVVRHREVIATEQHENLSPSRRRPRSIAHPRLASNKPNRVTTEGRPMMTNPTGLPISDSRLPSTFNQHEPICPEVLRTCYITHYRDVLRVCRRYFRQPQDAEDAAAEVFLKLFRVLHQKDAALPFLPWISRVAGRHCIDKLRGRKREKNLSLEEIESGAMADQCNPSPLTELLRKDEQGQVRDQLTRLPEIYRIPLMLRYYKRMSYGEIARTLNTRLPNVKIRIFRAKNHLRRNLRNGAGLLPTSS